VEGDGRRLVSKPGTFDMDDLRKIANPEERVCRMRCVEAWSMVIPWAGYSANRITVESFTPAAATPAEDNSPDQPSDPSTATVTFVRSDRWAPFSSRKSVLDLAESIGVPIDFQCRSGTCGTCRCKLLSGEVTMAVRDGLSEADEADGYILACQAHATEDLSIDA
jgi:ferredoxin